MSRHATEKQDSAQERVPSATPSPPLPPDHVLRCGAVLFPGAFDQHGCHLVVFPVDGQARLSSELGKTQVVDFIHYFLRLHNKKQEMASLASVVADLRQASLATTRFIAETLLLLEHKRTVHSVYIIQPKKKDVAKLLLKLLAPSKFQSASFKRVFLKEIPELSNYIDRSQLTASLGGYFVYCHQSWVDFIKEIDAFVQEFLSVVQRLPSCISTLQALSRLPLPTTFSELQHFCSTNEAKFQLLRRELGLDELLRLCESVVEKMRNPELEPCYQAMAGTSLFTHTAFDMLQNYHRIAAAVEKVELLWQQTFSKARLELQVFQLRESALQITEQIEKLLQETLQPYKIEIAKDAAKAATSVSQFEVSIHTPAMALVRCAEDVIHTLSEILPLDGKSREHWVLDLERLKGKLHSAVHCILQTLRAVCNYHQYYNKASKWYSLVLCENFLQELLSGVDTEDVPTQRRRNWGSIPAWRHKLFTFMKKSPPPSMQELLHLEHLSNVITDDELHKTGKQMSQRCMILRKLLISLGPVAVSHLQLALQWQYELLRSSHGNQTIDLNSPSECNVKCDHGKEATCVPETPPSTAVSGLSAVGKPPSLSSFDSDCDGAGSSNLKPWGAREGVEVLSKLPGTRDSVDLKLANCRYRKEDIPSVSDAGDPGNMFDFSSVEDSSSASVQIIPKVTVDSFNFEIKVKRAAALPKNPWLSLPVDDLENSYTVTITPKPTPQRSPQSPHPSDSCTNAKHLHRHQDDPTETEVPSSTQSRGQQSRDWMSHSQSSLEDMMPSPLENILSSTIADEGDKSISTIEGIPTLLWDSYDLHQDAVDGMIDLSLKDWDVKEQEGLMDIEKILDRADEILQEEENVLAQEAVLDALLSSEVGHNHWPPCHGKDQSGVMSSSMLTEAGVLGLDDSLDSAKSEPLSDCTSAESLRETEAFEVDTTTPYNRPDLLTELHNIHVLDELIVEENLKIHELRCSHENPDNNLSGSKPLGTKGVSHVSKERKSFHIQTEKETSELEKLEKGLDKETAEKAHKDRADKVLKCSIMEKARAENTKDQGLFAELLSDGFNQFHKTHSAALDQNKDVSETEHIPAEISPDVVEEGTSHEDLLYCQDPISSEANPINSTTYFKEAPENVGVQPQQCTNEREFVGSDKNNPISKPEASLAPEMKPDNGEFDPGGKSILTLLPKMVKASLSLKNLVECESHPTELLDPGLSSAQDLDFVQLDVQHKSLNSLTESVTQTVTYSFFLNPNVMEHSNNNNNNLSQQHVLSEMATKDQEDELLHQQLDPMLPLDQCLEFDPGGINKLNEDLPDSVQTVDAMRVSGPGSPGIQGHLNSNMTQVSYFRTPLVLDTGSGLMKAGFADRDLPSVTFPTIIGMPKYEEIMNGNLEREAYIGHEAQRLRGVLTLKHPMKNGIVNNWDDMERIWRHTFQQLCVDPEDHPVLLTEAAMNPLENRRHMVEIMFDCFSVPFSYVATQAVLALYAAGRSTGVVFDSGDGVSHSVPVFEGYCLPHAVQRFPLAGTDVTVHLKKLLQEQGVCMRTTAEMEIVREIKEKCCYVALDYESELTSSCREMHYTMPDGQIITVGTEGFRAPEILFKPELIGQDHYGMHESIFKSVSSSDIDLRRCLLGNIVLSGGNTLLAGLPERLQGEIKGLLPANTGQCVCVTSPADRDFSVWSGGAVLANLPTFSCAWISREEYEEYGPQIVFRKCF